MELLPDEIVESVHTAKVVIMRPHDDRLLVLWRSYDDDWRPGGSDLPGGGVEGEESAEAAACRETFQETGIRIGEAALVPLVEASRIVERPHGLVAIHQRLFAAVVGGQEPVLSDEHHDSGWYPIDEAVELFSGQPNKQNGVLELHRRVTEGGLPVAC
jgi:8-oxo-dGTP pyrophosphatase MutT (NUDIX family)